MIEPDDKTDKKGNPSQVERFHFSGEREKVYTGDRIGHLSYSYGYLVRPALSMAKGVPNLKIPGFRRFFAKGKRNA